jgi:hypothetical protein
VLYNPDTGRRQDLLRRRRTRCLVCGEPFDRKTNNQRLCGRRQCRNEFRRYSERFLGVLHPSLKDVIQTQNSSIKSKPKTGLKSGRAWRIVTGPDVPEINLRIPLDPETVARLKRTRVDYFETAGRNAIIKRDTPPVNVVGGYKFPSAPIIDLAIKTEAAAPVTSATIAGDGLDIPNFLKRTPEPEISRLRDQPQENGSASCATPSRSSSIAME